MAGDALKRISYVAQICIFSCYCE